MATVLKRGSKGAAVEDVQRLLNRTMSGPQLTVDGDYGMATEAVVTGFQKAAGLVVDGKVGPQTLTALRRASTAPKQGKPEPDKSAIWAPAPEAKPASSVSKAPPNIDSLKLYDTTRPIHEIIVHCTATPEGKDYTVDDIRSWHKQRGWTDVGYHYVIYRDGRVMLGRPIGQIGAHCEGHNTGTIGISYVGGLAADAKTAKDTRTAEQHSSLLWLAEKLADKFPIAKVTGHNEYNAGKACPSFSVRKDKLSTLV